MSDNIFYNFLYNMWIMGLTTEEKIHEKVPNRISEEEYQEIISSPKC